MLIIFCIALMFMLEGCTSDQSFVTKTVCLGEDVTLTCSRQSESSGVLFWIKLVSGNLPEVLGATYTFDNANVNKIPRVKAKQEPGIFVLQLTKAELSDTAFYYCEQVVELRATILNTTFLSVKEQESDITAIIQVPPSAPVHPGDSVTLQCSVLSDRENKTCPGDHSVYWFRAGSDESQPSVVCTHANISHECEKSPETQTPQKCVYSFSKNISSSDAGTYYCAVATCGEILFGNGTKLDVEETSVRLFVDSQRANTILSLLCAALVISLIAVALLIYTVKKKKCYRSNARGAALQTNSAAAGDQRTDEDSVVYYMTNSTRGKAVRRVKRGAHAADGESIYSDVRVVG